MRVNKTLAINLIALGILLIYILGFFSPKQYCLDDICIERPTFYRFHQFISSDNVLSSEGWLTFSYQNHFVIEDKGMNIISFKDIVGNGLSLLLENTSFLKSMGDRFEIYQSMYKVNPYHKCYIFESPLQETETWDDHMVLGVFKDSNLSFTLFADDQELLTKALQEICVSDEMPIKVIE